MAENGSEPLNDSESMPPLDPDDCGEQVHAAMTCRCKRLGGHDGDHQCICGLTWRWETPVA